MRGVRISYLIEHPEYIPQLAQWLFEQWDSILGEKTPEARIKKLKTHMNRDKLPIAWVAHANGQLLGTAALRVYDLEGARRSYSLAWRSICRLTFSPSGYWCRTVRRRRGGGSVSSDTHPVFVHAR